MPPKKHAGALKPSPKMASAEVKAVIPRRVFALSPEASKSGQKHREDDALIVEVVEDSTGALVFKVGIAVFLLPISTDKDVSLALENQRNFYFPALPKEECRYEQYGCTRSRCEYLHKDPTLNNCVQDARFVIDTAKPYAYGFATEKPGYHGLVLTLSMPIVGGVLKTGMDHVQVDGFSVEKVALDSHPICEPPEPFKTMLLKLAKSLAQTGPEALPYPPVTSGTTFNEGEQKFVLQTREGFDETRLITETLLDFYSAEALRKINKSEKVFFSAPAEVSEPTPFYRWVGKKVSRRLLWDSDPTVTENYDVAPGDHVRASFTHPLRDFACYYNQNALLSVVDPKQAKYSWTKLRDRTEKNISSVMDRRVVIAVTNLGCMQLAVEESGKKATAIVWDEESKRVKSVAVELVEEGEDGEPLPKYSSQFLDAYLSSRNKAARVPAAEDDE